MTLTALKVSHVHREMAHLINPIISELKLEETLHSVSRLIEEIGAIAGECSGIHLAMPHLHLLCSTLSAALDYEQNYLISHINSVETSNP